MESMGLNNFWKNKKVLITGHTGFKGGWLSLWLNSLGAEVTGYSLSPITTPSLFETARIKDITNSHIGDIRDVEKFQRIFLDCNPEIVFHMAAQPLVRESYINPHNTYSVNVMGLVNTLENVRKSNMVKAFVNVTSDKCYENKEWLWGYRENEPMGGRDPYSSSKACSEIITAAYRDSYFNSKISNTFIASARAGNVIGGGDWSQDRLIPDLFRAINENKILQIRNPHSIRPWQHTLEPLFGYIKLAENLFKNGHNFAEAWNFGPNENEFKSVGWIVDYIFKYLKHSNQWDFQEDKKFHEAHYLKLDSSKAKNLLDWSPKWTLNEALQKTCDWNNAFLQNKDMQAFSLNQIKEYLAA